MRKKNEDLGPAFRRVLACFDTRAEAARQFGLQGRQALRSWTRRGWIPLEWAVRVSAATNGKVTPLEIINESCDRRLRAQERAKIRAQARLEAAQEGAA